MKFLDTTGVARLWAAMTAHVAAQMATAAPAESDYLVSADPNVIVTHEFTAGKEDIAIAALPGMSNVIRGFVSGEDKIHVPLALIREINAETTLTAGPLDAARFGNGVGADMLLYDNGGILSYCPDDDSFVPLLLLDGKPTLAATDITIG